MDQQTVFDSADETMSEREQFESARYRETEWALMEAVRCSVPAEAIAILQRETGVYL